MEKGQTACRPFASVGIAAIIAVLVGCAHNEVRPEIKFKSETEVAVANIKMDWLKRCEGLPAAMPANEVGSLLQDYADMAKALAECIQRHTTLADYLEIVVQKERATP